MLKYLQSWLAIVVRQLQPSSAKSPTAPTNLSLVPVSSRSLTASWSAPEQINGVLGVYTVSWTIDGMNEESTTAETNFTIDGLDVCVTYSVSVTASTGGGKGPASDPVLGTTDEEAPPEVTEFTNTALDTNAITLAWTRPVTACNVTEYIISYNGTAMWGEQDTNDNSVTFPSDGSSTEEFTVTGLVPYSSYTMCIVALVGNMTGANACLEQAVATKEDVPSEPTNLTVNNSTETSLLVSWEEPRQHNGILLQYTVTWSVGGTILGSGATNETLYTIEGLSSCITYTVTVTASTSIGEGAESNTSTTADEIPAPAPVSCSLSGSLVTVTWTESKTKCAIVSNTVSWEGDVLWSNDQDSGDYTAGATDSSFTLTRTVSYTRYTVSVAATVAGGVTGMEGTCMDQLVTPEEAPSAPRSLNLSEATSTSLTVTWEAPEVLNGWLRNYTVTWGLGSDTRTREIDNATLNCKIEGLETGTSYTISVKAVTVNGSEPATASFNTLPSPTNVGAIIGAFVGGLLVAALLAVAYIKRDWIRTRMTSSDNHIKADRYDKQLGHYPKLDRELDVKIKSLASHPGSLTREFDAMDAQSYEGSTIISTLPVNAKKNRYANILPFDESRVVLEDNMADGNDYINASFVPSVADRSLVFVATQTPKENTVVDFWRMVWNLNVQTIVMLSDKKDEHTARSDQYWPRGTDSDVIVQQFVIKLMTERVTATFTERRLIVTRGGDSREVSQFQFSEWTAHEVSNSTKELLEFLCEIRKNVQPEQKRVVVHCLAGVGRTGTLIALWNLQQLAETLPQGIDVEDTILQIRRHRMQLVQTKEQYFFLLETLLEYLRNPAYWLPVQDKEIYMTPSRQDAEQRHDPPHVYSSDKEIYMTPSREDAEQRHHRAQQSPNSGVPDKQIYMAPPIQYTNSSVRKDGSNTGDQDFFQNNYLDPV